MYILYKYLTSTIYTLYNIQVKLFATQVLSQTQKNVSEPQTGIEPTTFWSPVRHPNHWATRTQMAERRPRYVPVRTRDIRSANTAVSICQYILLTNIYIWRWHACHIYIYTSLRIVFTWEYINIYTIYTCISNIVYTYTHYSVYIYMYKVYICNTRPVGRGAVHSLK